MDEGVHPAAEREPTSGGPRSVHEVPQQLPDAILPWLSFEHVLADKEVEALNVFDGHRLIENVHGFGTKPVHLL